MEENDRQRKERNLAQLQKRKAIEMALNGLPPSSPVFFGLEVQDKPFPCLGVPPRNICSKFGIVNSVNRNTAYGRLPRPATLPGKTPCLLKDKRSQDLLQKFWDGHCTYVLTGPNDDITNLNLRAEICCGNNAEWISLNGSYCGGPAIACTSSLFLLDDEKIPELLPHRVLHNFCRWHGWALDWSVLNITLQNLIEAYDASKKHRHEKLDVYILEADLTHNFRTSRQTEPESQPLCDAVYFVVLALESLGRCEEAGYVCAESVELYPANKHTAVYATAAIIFKQALLFDTSLKYFAKAFKHYDELHRGVWDFEDESAEDLLRHFLDLLWCDFVARRREKEAGKFTTVEDDELIHVAFCNLLKVSGLYAGNGFPAAPLSSFVLKPKLRTPRAAKRTLIMMFRSGCSDTYRKILLSALLREGNPMRAYHGDPAFPEDIFRITQKRDVKLAKKTLRQFEGSTCAACRLVEKVYDPFMWCPCQQHAYCSRDCQRSHWNQH